MKNDLGIKMVTAPDPRKKFALDYIKPNYLFTHHIFNHIIHTHYIRNHCHKCSVILYFTSIKTIYIIKVLT